MADAALLGRTVELAQLAGVIAAIPRGPRSIILEGEAGIGKTVLWSAAVEAARSGSLAGSAAGALTVLVARAVEAERDLAHVVLMDLLSPVARDALPTLPKPQAQAFAIRRRSRVATLTLTMVVIGTLAACAGSPASPSPAPPSPSASASAAADGDLVGDYDVGGRTLHLVCVGPTGLDEPIILLEAGLGAPYQTWSEVLSSMSADHRLCAYDRAGLGASEPAPEAARTATDILADLKAMISAADVNGPFVLVGHSIASVPVSLFAATYPTEVAGVVLVDPRGPRVSGHWAAALPPASAGEPAAVAATRDELSTFERDPSLNHEQLDLGAIHAQGIAALDADGPLFASRPVRVLSAARSPESWNDLPSDLAATFDSIWLAGQQEFADEATDGELVVVPESGHEIQRDQPAAVVAAIEQVLAAVAGT